MLDQQRLPDQAQHGAATVGRPAGGGELRGERFDHVEHLVDLALVAGEGHRLRQGVGHHQKALRRQVLDLDWAAGGLLLVADRRNLENGRLVVALSPDAADPRLEPGERVLL